MGEAPQPTQIFVVSDGTGDTAASVANAAMAQFQTPWRMRRFGGIRQVSVARRIIEEAERAARKQRKAAEKAANLKQKAERKAMKRKAVKRAQLKRRAAAKK